MPSARTQPFTVATLLFAREEANEVRTFLEAIAPDQSLSFLLLEEDHWTDDERFDTRTRTFGASRLRNEILGASGVVQPNSVYFLSRGRTTALLDGALQLNAGIATEPPLEVSRKFLASLGADQGARACVIIFAGSRVDADTHESALSLIAEADGLVLVQDEPAGQFRRIMKTTERTNVDATMVAPADVASLVMEHAEPLIAETRPQSTTELYREVEAILPAVCEVLLNVTAHDFSQYKSSTLIRRTLRRLHFLRLESAASYLARLRLDQTEARRLFDDLLVSVTSFFRDTEAFQALAQLVIPRLFAPVGRQEPVRIWVAGCATGEEAYSIAMLIREYAGSAGELPPVQIFASDLDEGALAHARKGRYAPIRLAHVSPERISRFFTRVGKSYQVSKELREMVLFTRHSVTSDPPYSNLDLISCRNLLIYLGDELHRRVIPLFHYALRPKGLLFLGPSESISTHTELFRPIDVKHRISERLRTSKRNIPGLTSRVAMVERSRAGNATNSDAEILQAMQATLAEQFTPTSIVVTDEGHIVVTSGNVDEYLAVSPGSFVNSITRLVREGLRVAMRSALREAVAMRARAVHTGASLRTSDGVQRVTITVQPLPATADTAGLFMVVFQPNGLPVSPHASPTPQHTEAANALIERMEVDLTTTREELQRTVQDLEAVNEELKSSNEELLSMNEELQSSNDELESSKEDMEAVNDALEDSNNDLANLLVSTGIPTIFLDDVGKVRRTTPTAALIYNLLPDDVGRPLSHFTHRAVSMPPLPPLAAVQGAHRAIEHEVAMSDGSWYTRRVLPYVTPEGHYEGMVVTFVDLTDRRRYESDLEDSEARLRAIIDSMFAFVGVLDIDGTLLEVNQAALGVGGMQRDEVVGRYFWDCAWFTHDENVRERLRDGFERASGGEVVRYDEVARTANDGRIHIDFTMQPVYREGALQFVIPSAVDVTHRVEAEERLRHQRNVTRTITENATTAIFMTDANRRCTFANPAAEAMTGYTADELIGHVLHDRIHYLRPDGSRYPAEECTLDRALPDGNQIRNHEELFVRKDGTFFPVVCSVSLINAGGDPAGLVVEVRDVTHEQQAARAVAESQARFRQLAESIPQLTWMAHPDGNIFWYNQRWYDYTGTTLEEMRDWGWKEVHDPEVLPVVMDRWQSSLASGASFDMVFPIRAADGSYRPFLTRVNPFRDEQGKIILWFGTNTDVSAEHDRAESLRRRQRELQTLADNSPDILTRFDRNHRHVFVNSAVERATGLPAHQFIGRTNRELGMPAAQCDLWERTIDRVFETGREQSVDFEFDSPTGRQYFVGRFVPELGANGEIQYALGFTRDRTTERLAENAVQDANRRKDEFLATLAHELRNPLAPLRNGLEILRLTHSADSRAVQVRDIMERQVTTMTRLIDDLLDISRISLGKVELKRATVEISSVLDAAVEVSRPTLLAAQHQLDIDVPDKTLLLHADSTRVAQVIGNLLHNAAKYTPERGRITLSAHAVGNEVVIRVSDNGIGIPGDMLTRVFEMFTQIAHSSTKAQGGLGIGLALVRQLVEMHGGSVSAESEGAGKGSTFTVRLPRAGRDEVPRPETTGAGTAAPITEGGEEQLNILVVDDNIDAAESLASVLQLMGHNARTAFTGTNGLRELAASVPDFVFLDIGLPDVSGYEIAASIRGDERLDRTIIVALTGWGSNDHRRRSVEAGFDYHLTKPADVAIIRRILTRAVR
ncbi:MAG: PAS domain S-box protein [Phycisphaerae bacterium]|nr:PAS domain S-box protein [Gemmatimonadaceae bacterium]